MAAAGGARLGLIVNPIAGLGGRVGLKGTDSARVVREALRLGGRPEAPARAEVALGGLLRAGGAGAQVLAAPGAMGAESAAAAGVGAAVVGERAETTGAEDTVRASRAMEEAGADLILFAGGDGTARDVHRAIGTRVPVVGIPAGVKMHSAVYATSPLAAGTLAGRYLLERDLPLREAEVMDIDEDAFREGSLSASLYGYMQVPYLRALVQGAKSGSEPSDEAAAAAVASEVASRIDPDRLYVLGPGTTLRAIAWPSAAPATCSDPTGRSDRERPSMAPWRTKRVTPSCSARLPWVCWKTTTPRWPLSFTAIS